MIEWLTVGAGLALMTVLIVLRDLYGPGVLVGAGRAELVDDQADDFEGGRHG